MSHILPVRRVGRLPRARFRAFSADLPRRSSLESLSRARPPRARQISLTAAERHRLKKLAYSRTALCQQVIRVRIVLDASRSASTVRRIPAADTIKPWQHRSWLFIRDPNFAARATRVLELYARVWDGVPLTGDEYVISSETST